MVHRLCNSEFVKCMSAKIGKSEEAGIKLAIMELTRKGYTNKS